MKKRLYATIILLLEAALLSSCKNKDLSTEITDNIIGTEYGEWELINAVTAGSDRSMVSSIAGYKINNVFSVTIGAEWKEVLTLELGYELGSDEIECSAITTYIDSGETIEFYCRAIYDVHEIEKITYADESKEKVKSSDSTKCSIYRSLQYGWIIYDENNAIIDDTTQEFQHPSPSPTTDAGFETDIVEAYILESSYSEIEKEALSQLSNEELRYLRNGIYAFCGRKFDDDDLQEYYSKYDWYAPTIDGNRFHWDTFNDYQEKTIYNILEIEESRK